MTSGPMGLSCPVHNDSFFEVDWGTGPLSGTAGYEVQCPCCGATKFIQQAGDEADSLTSEPDDQER